MNKQQIYKKFKKATLKKTYLNLGDYMNYLHYSKNVPFEDMDHIKDIKPIIQKGLTWDMKTTSIKDYDKIKGNWFKSNMALYEVE